MYKLKSLRQHIGQAVPELKRDPDKLAVLMRGGRIACAGQASLSFEYSYTAQIIVLDYAGESDSLMLPLLVWLRTHQPDYFDNQEKQERGFRFNIEFNSTKTVDVEIEIDLTESVIVTPVAGGAGGVDEAGVMPPPGRYTLQHKAEPSPALVGRRVDVPHWDVYDVDGNLIGSFDLRPADFDHAPALPTPADT